MYTEPARTYKPVSITVAVLLAAFVFDVSLGGGLAHIIGWILAAVVIVGTHVLLVYAARSTHSLTLDADELRVGQEAVARGDIVTLRPDRDPYAAVLGWPAGLPASAKGVTIRLADDRDVVVPTRHPHRLAAALGVATTPDVQAAPVRTATSDDLAQLPELDHRAEAIFRVSGYELPNLPFDAEALAAAKAVFVVGDPVEAFAWLGEVDGAAHLVEIAVAPNRMRQGYGTRLMQRAVEWARSEAYSAMTLTTYADIAWNAPWYRTLGFVDVDVPTPGLQIIRAREADAGLDTVGRRVVLRLEL